VHVEIDLELERVERAVVVVDEQRHRVVVGNPILEREVAPVELTGECPTLV
jgi:hypothetical protein